MRRGPNQIGSSTQSLRDTQTPRPVPLWMQIVVFGCVLWLIAR